MQLGLTTIFISSFDNLEFGGVAKNKAFLTSMASVIARDCSQAWISVNPEKLKF
ncbi:MAG: hypothetical protein WC375_05570 [Methanomassiliicoccales archaeon]